MKVLTLNASVGVCVEGLVYANDVSAFSNILPCSVSVTEIEPGSSAHVYRCSDNVRDVGLNPL